MKLCAVTQSYAATGGGVRTMLHAQRDWFREHGLQHTMIVPGAEDSVTRDGLSTTYTIASPLLPGSQMYRLMFRNDKVLRILREELPDVIETHCPYTLPWAAFRHRARHGGIVSATYMTDLPVAYVEAPLSSRTGPRVAHRMRGLAEAYLRTLYRRCDAVIAISQSVYDRLLEYHVPRVHLVPLGVDIDTFHPSRRDPALRESLGVAPNDLLIVYAGRLDSEKRPDLVASAFEQVRRTPAGHRVHLVLAGDGPLREPLAARAGEIGNMRVLPFVEGRAELARLLASADLYASGMPHETFGLSVVEAQACGLPVLGVRAGAMTDRVREGETGFLVPPGDAGAMAQRIIDTPREQWRALGSAAREHVAHEFSWNRTFEKLDSIYRAALQSRA